jgi:hypothetical protein
MGDPLFGSLRQGNPGGRFSVAHCLRYRFRPVLSKRSEQFVDALWSVLAFLDAELGCQLVDFSVS